jgi:UDP-4-amino-4,6-dideoxy-N-acetyl-beta-L-altrosamine transaminase
MPEKFIPYGRQSIDQSDLDAVASVLNSDFLTQGPLIPRFEKEFSTFVDASHAVAVNSATAALHIACKAVELGAGDLMWTSPITFVASANCAVFCGAEVDFIDVNLKTGNICSAAFEEKLKKAKEKGKLPKVIIPVHFAGASAEMEKISKLARENGIKIIEDASHATGGIYKDKKIGSCYFSDITVFSFHPVKILTTGEGGIATTSSEELKNKMCLLRSHGVTRDPLFFESESHGDWYYEQVDLGWNYRLTDIAAALGLSQLKRVKSFVKKRNQQALFYNKNLLNKNIVQPRVDKDNYSAFHLYRIGVDENARKHIFDYLRSKMIGVNVHYIPVHTQPYYRKLGFDWGTFPNAEKFYNQSISLPLYPDLGIEEQERVIQEVNFAVKNFCD